MSGRGRPTKGTPRRPEDAREAYLTDSTLSELSIPIQHQHAASPWAGWFTTPGIDDNERPPPLPEGTIPHVKIEDFQRYLGAVGSNLEKYENSKDTEQSTSPQGDGSSVTPTGGQRQMPTAPSNGLAQAMVEVPLQYFREDFSLDWDLLGPVDSPEKQQAVVEALSFQLDRIETHLTSEIAGRYSSFFEASIYIQELQEDLQRLVDQVVQKRQDMAAVIEQAEQGSETATALGRQKKNLLETLELAMAVQQIVHAKTALQNNLDAASYAGLDYIGTLEVLDQVSDSCHGPVMSLRAVGDVPEYMDDVKGAMKDIMIADLVERTVLDVSKQVQAVMAQESTEQHQNGNIGADYVNDDDGDFAAASVPLVASLCRIQSFDEAIQAVQKDLHRGMLSLLAGLAREYLVQYCKVDAEDVPDDLAPGPLAVALNRVDGNNYARLLTLNVEAAKEYFAHCQRVVQMLLHAVNQVSDLSAAQQAKHVQHIKECAHRAAHLAVTCWSNYLTSWTTVAGPDKLGLSDLCQILDITDSFASVVEGHAGKAVGALQGPIQQCCKAALDLMHASNAAKLTLALESEKWTYSPISEDAVACIELFGGQSGGANTVLIDGVHFQMIDTVQVLLSVLQQNLSFTEAVPAFIADVGQRVVELLRSFNSRACQLILGAGAMQVSGLKSITVKHLAVACQSVRVVLALFPMLGAKFVAPISMPRQNLIAKELEKTRQDMTVHCTEINNKIITIMCERMTPMHDFARLLSASLGSPAAPGAPPSQSGMAVNILKQLQILADILTSTALEEDKDKIMQQVLRNFVGVLTAAYDDSQLDEMGLDEQAAADLDYLLKSIHALPVSKEITEGCTHDMRALYLRKVSSIQSRKAAATTISESPPPSPSPPPPVAATPNGATAAIPTVEIPLDDSDAPIVEIPLHDDDPPTPPAAVIQTTPEPSS